MATFPSFSEYAKAVGVTIDPDTGALTELPKDMLFLDRANFLLRLPSSDPLTAVIGPIAAVSAEQGAMVVGGGLRQQILSITATPVYIGPRPAAAGAAVTLSVSVGTNVLVSADLYGLSGTGGKLDIATATSGAAINVGGGFASPVVNPGDVILVKIAQASGGSFTIPPPDAVVITANLGSL